MKTIDRISGRSLRKRKFEFRQQYLEKKHIKWKHAEWKHAFAPVQRRVLLKHMLKCLSLGILSSLAAALVLSALSFLFPFEYLIHACLSAVLCAIVIGLVAGWYKRPSVYETARIVDRLGLQEKVLTACELDERDDIMAELQRKDAIESLSALDVKRIPLRLPKSHGIAFMLLLLSLVIVNLIPNPMGRIVRERKALRAEIHQQLEELEKTWEKVLEQESLTQEQRQQLALLMKELAERLEQTGEYKEALKEISKAEEELTALADKVWEESIGQLAEHLGTLEETGALARALHDRNMANLDDELNKLKEQLENAADNKELAERLKDILEKAAESTPDGEIKDKLAAASGSLGNGRVSEALGQLGQAMSQAVNAGSAMGDARYALQQMRSGIAQAAGEIQYAHNPSSQSGSGEGRGNGEGQGAGQGQGQGSGSGQGAAAGRGDSGQAGSGVGSGTAGEGSGQSSAGTSGGRNGSSQMGDENAETVYEQIYAPERLGDGGEATHVSGRPTGEGQVISETGGKGIGDLSGYIPYKEVYQEYRNEAMRSMDRRTLPPAIQEIVRKYFETLE